jgi:hypothetical protein
MGLSSSTPGLTNHLTTMEINNAIVQIQRWRKKSYVQLNWQDRQSMEALSEKLFNLYMDQKEKDQKAFIEITLPDFGMPVLYGDNMNLTIG